MQRLAPALIAILLVLGALLPASPAAAESGWSHPLTYLAQWEVESPPPAPYNDLLLIVEFEPGAVAEAHWHSGPAFVTVLQGEVTLISDEGETTYFAGDPLVEVPESVYVARNDGEGLTRLLVTYLIPEGRPTTVLAEGGEAVTVAPGPTTALSTERLVDDPPAAFDLWHLAMRIEPGQSSLEAPAEGDTFVLVTDGEVTLETAEGAAVYAAGESFFLPIGTVASVRNDGAEPAEAVIAFVVPTDHADGLTEQ